MPRRTLATWFILLGLDIGLVGDVLFYAKPIGLSFPLFIALIVGVTLAASKPAQAHLNWRNLWLLGPMLIFAVMVAVRADPTIGLLNLGAVLTRGALGLHYLTAHNPLDEATLSQQIGAVLETTIMLPFLAIPEVSDSWAGLRERSWQGRALVAVARGLAIAVPILIVFAVLLASADAMFAGYVEKLWKLLALNPDARLIDQALITLSLGWLATGGLAYALARRPRPQSATITVPAADGEAEDEADAEAYFTYGDDAPVPLEKDDAPPKRKTRPLFRLGMIESGIVLGLVDGLFAVFVVVQFAYFFGGQQTITNAGLTYAQYARRGFFELVAVSVMTLGLALWLDNVTLRTQRRDQRIFTGLAFVLVALTTVMLVSASQRMYLYEEAFGFTHLRVMVHVCILWLGVLFAVFLLSMLRVKPNVFAFGVLLVGIGYLLTLNVMNIDLYIADHNIARFHQGYALDLGFLGRLSADATPAVAALFEESENDPDAHEWAGQWLARELRTLDQKSGQTIFSFNLAHQQASVILEPMRDRLPAYDSSFFWSSAYGGDYFDVYATTPEPSR